MRTARGLLLPALLLLSACATVRPQFSGGTRAPAPVTVLQVPYVAQSVLLCGGAAIAMIERWWGRRGVFAEEFSSLVRRDEGGIRTSDLAQAVTSRGWNTREITGTASLVQQSLADSAPVLALIRVAKQRYHYVVIVAWQNGVVTYHDPAGTPFATLDSTTFMARWNGAKRWALLVAPGPPAPAISAPRPATGSVTFASLPCHPWLDHAADAATAGNLTLAEQQLDSAAAQCPTQPLVVRERAGVRFRQMRLADTRRLAEDYTHRAPTDSLGWQLLGSSSYLLGDLRSALDAWNHVGRPVVDLVRIDGLARTPFRDVQAVMGISPASVLTAPRLAIAARRLADLPTLGATRTTYTAVPGGVVEMRAVANERPILDPRSELLLNTAIDAVFRRDVHLSLASPLRLGELWTVQWRWQGADPRVAIRLAIPAQIGVPVVAHVEQSWETYRFAGNVPQGDRNASSFQLTGWAHPSLEALAGVRVEQWTGQRNFVALTAGAGYHERDDRVAVLLDGDYGVARGDGDSYQRLHARAAFTPPVNWWRTQWTMLFGVDLATAATPTGLQPLAGGDFARAIPLRAHPFIIDSRLPSARIARTITHGGVAGDRPAFSLGAMRVGVGVFLDAANVGQNLAGGASRFFLDAGGGLRIALAGTQWSALRIDVARGLTADRRWGLTAGLAPAWPIRLKRQR